MTLSLTSLSGNAKIRKKETARGEHAGEGDSNLNRTGAPHTKHLYMYAVAGVRWDNLGNIKRAIGSAVPGISNRLSPTVIRQVTVLSTIVCRNGSCVSRQSAASRQYNRQRQFSPPDKPVASRNLKTMSGSLDIYAPLVRHCSLAATRSIASFISRTEFSPLFKMHFSIHTEFSGAFLFFKYVT